MSKQPVDRMSRRWLLGLAVASAAGTVLVGCSQSASPPATPPAAAAPATAAPAAAAPTSPPSTVAPRNGASPVATPGQASGAATPATAATPLASATGLVPVPYTTPSPDLAKLTPQDGGTLRIGVGSMNDFNSFTSTTVTTIEELVGSRLASTNWTLDKQIPDLAESWEVQGNGASYVFKLRKNVKWHDGQPFTAQDVAWTFTTGLDPEAGSWMGNQVNDIVGAAEIKAGKTKQVSGIKVVDDYTIQFDIAKPSATWLMRQSVLNIFPKHILGEIALKDLAKNSYWTQQHTMTGPFKWTSYAAGQNVQCTRYDNYHFGKPHIDKAIFVFFANGDSNLLALEKGSVDSGGIPITEVDRFVKLPHIDVVPLRGGVANWISINTSKPEFADKRFRQAVAYAIDKDTIIKTLWKGLAVPLYGFFLQDFYKNPNVNKYPYNPEKAKQLLKEVNWNPNRVIDFTYYYADKFDQGLMAAMQAYLQQVGIKVKIRLIDTATVGREVDQQGTYDWMYGALGVPLDPDQATLGLVSNAIYPAGMNRPKWKNSQLDTLMEKGRSTLDPKERQKYYYQVEEILADELPYIWLWEPVRPQGINKRVIGMAEHQGLVYNMSAYRAAQEWWIKS